MRSTIPTSMPPGSYSASPGNGDPRGKRHTCGGELIGQFKGGQIGRGYAVCSPDPLESQLMRDGCPIDRIECQVPFTLAGSGGFLTGATITHTVVPVGNAYLRELRAVRILATTPGDDVDIILQQMTAAGRFAFSGNVTSSAAGNIPQGIAMNGLAGGFQNYVVPTGVYFGPSQPLTLTLAALGGVESYRLVGFYDVVRLG